MRSPPLVFIHPNRTRGGDALGRGEPRLRVWFLDSSRESRVVSSHSDYAGKANQIRSPEERCKAKARELAILAGFFAFALPFRP